MGVGVEGVAAGDDDGVGRDGAVGIDAEGLGEGVCRVEVEGGYGEWGGCGERGRDRGSEYDAGKEGGEEDLGKHREDWCGW